MLNINNLKINSDNLMKGIKFLGTMSEPSLINGKFDDKILRRVLAGRSYQIITHNGRFHADEVFSVALVLMVRWHLFPGYSVTNDNWREFVAKEIIWHVRRVTNIEKLFADGIENFESNLVLDLKGGHYDHHHDNPDNRSFRDGNKAKPYATFGSLWRDIGSAIFDLKVDATKINSESFKNVSQIVDSELVYDIDMADNFGPIEHPNPITKIISDINSMHQEDCHYRSNQFHIEEHWADQVSKEITPQFIEAVISAWTILKNEIVSAQNRVEGLINVYKCRFQKIPNDIFYHGKEFYYIEIPEVKEDDLDSVYKDQINVPIQSMNEFEEITEEGSKLIGFLLNLNQNDRDNTYRIVTSRWAVLDVEGLKPKAKELGIEFIHNGGFLVTFKEQKNAIDFANKLHFVGSKNDQVILGIK